MEWYMEKQEKRCNRMSLIILCIGKRLEKAHNSSLFFLCKVKLGTIKNHINGHIGLIKY